MAEDPKLTLLGKKIAHQEVAVPCWNDFCQLTSGGCGTQPLLKCLFTHEGCFGTCWHASTTACLKAWASFIWEWSSVTFSCCHGRKATKLLNSSVQVSEFEFTHVMFNWIAWPSCGDQKHYGVFPSSEHLYRGYLRCHGFLNNSPTSQFHHPLLTNQNTMWPNWPTWQNWPIFLTNLTDLTHVWPTVDQVLTKFSPTWLDQLFTNFSQTWLTFHQLDQLFTNLTKLTWQQTTSCEADWIE